MNTTKVELHKRKVKLKGRKTATYYTLRWYGSDGKRYSEAVGRGATLAEAKEACRRKQANLANGAELVDRPQAMTVGGLLGNTAGKRFAVAVND